MVLEQSQESMRPGILVNSLHIRDELDKFWKVLFALWSHKHLKWIRKQSVYVILTLAIYQIL